MALIIVAIAMLVTCFAAGDNTCTPGATLNPTCSGQAAHGRSHLQVSRDSVDLATTVEVYNATAVIDVGQKAKRSAACQSACDSLDHALKKQQIALKLSPPSCDDFCISHGCDCLIPWEERCKVNSCVTCPKCIGGPSPSPTQANDVVTELRQVDFTDGTYIITSPGKYILKENIEFEPDTPGHFPPLQSTKYAKSNGYWLGFFAAISIAADNVTVDLQGHTIGMSEKFLMIQRFFSIIQLGSKPFLANVGPPQFSSSSTPLIAASHVTIKNGVLGRSSHMGIHGNENRHVRLQGLVIRDFETGGIQFNGAENVEIADVTVGPSLGAPGSSGTVPGLATLSQADLIMRIAQGFEHQNEPVFQTLNRTIQDHISHGHEQTNMFNNPAHGYEGLPDGSALYGISFHRTGPAINDFAVCSSAQQQNLASDPLDHISLKNVTIKDLHLKSDEVVKMLVDGKPVLGPAGDVVQILRLKDSNSMYKATPLSQAQLRMAELKSAAASAGQTPDEIFAMFGSTNIPQAVAGWMRGSVDYETATNGATFVCGGDAMSHVNKGVVGLRLEFVTQVALEGVRISGLKNLGVPSPFKGTECGLEPDAINQGAGVRAVSIGGGTELAMTDGFPVGIDFDASNSGSSVGQVFPFVDEGTTVVN